MFHFRGGRFLESHVADAPKPTGVVKPLVRGYASGDYPDHVKVRLPALSPTMEMGTIVSWEKKEGEVHAYFTENTKQICWYSRLMFIIMVILSDSTAHPPCFILT